MATQLKDLLSKVALYPEWTEKMRAQVDIWEKEQNQSSKSFAQNLELKIKETDEKLDKLVNAFLDGTIEKETYLIKKDELVKLKTELLERKRDFGRKGNNWNEPLREWLNLACHVEKLATSSDFYEIKAMVEKIGTNRRLLDRIVFLDFKKPFDLIPYYKRSYEKEIFAKTQSKNFNLSLKNSQSIIWSHLLNAVRTYFENLITET
jgi:hypothetical protein